MMLKLMLRLFCVGVLAVCYSSCQEETAQEPDGPVELSAFVQRAKRQFENSVVHAGAVNEDNARGYLAKSPQWERAYTIDMSVGQGLVVPVYYDKPTYFSSDVSGKYKLASDNYTNLLVYVGDDRQMHYELLSAFPAGQVDGRFTGVIYVEDWQGYPLRQFRYKADGTIETLRPIEVNEKPVTNGYIQTFTICYGLYGWNYSAADPAGSYWSIDLGCDSYTIDVGETYSGPTGGDYGSGGGGGDTGGGGDGGGCARLRAMNAPCDGGGSDPNNPSPSDYHLQNDVDNPCFNLQVHDLIDSHAMVPLLFAGTNLTIDINFRDEDLGTGMDHDEATTDVYGGAAANYRHFDITVNTRLEGASDEYIMATLIHEVYHVYNHLYAPADKRDNESSHTWWTENGKVDEMANMLRQFYPNLSFDDAKALMWGGLEDTQKYNELSQAEKDRIHFVKSDHLRGAQGTKCGNVIAGG